MAEREAEIKCWSCGQTEANCGCEDGFIPNIINPPKEPPPFCGGTIYINEPWADSSRYDEVMLRPCCHCDEMWMCNHHEHLYGRCPHCGALGIDGVGGNAKNYSEEGII